MNELRRRYNQVQIRVSRKSEEKRTVNKKGGFLGRIHNTGDPSEENQEQSIEDTLGRQGPRREEGLSRQSDT